MSAPDFQKVEKIFHAALECEPNQLDAFLSQKCTGDETLRREVEALLALHRRAGSFIETPVADVAAGLLKDDETDLLIAETIGHYKISKRISAGGMGAVYLAERADREYEKKVAIKLIKRGMDTDSVLRHFRNERQILATFDHPNIARLLDGGATESGLPYFVMEYVEGLPIDAYCNAHALSIVERLKLFRKVCAAVSYAHRHTVIHRDVKPSNILVTSDGTPKLLDFGIAKILQPGVATEPSVTLTGLRLMTPDYASPEQVRGQPVTTATDVYSLGVVLYQLLTGQKPYRLKTRTPEEISSAVLEQEPTRPSVVASAYSRFHTAWKPGPQLRGDLDNIVLMALRKEPERRYKSVEQLSEDIRRHLEARPVRARKDTFGYRAAKFMRRNKTATAAAALVLLSLVGGIIATTLQAHRARVQEGLARMEKARAERRFNDVRRLAHSVLFDYHDAIKDLPGATRVRDRLVKDALAYLDSLAKDAGGDLALQCELASAYDKFGDVRGTAGGASLGNLAGALENYRQALRIREVLVAANPRDPQARHDLAVSYRNIGYRLLDTDKPADGMEYLRKASSFYIDLTMEQPTDAGLQFELADVRNRMGMALNDSGNESAALDQYRAALATCEKLVASNPTNREYRQMLAFIHENIGRVLFLKDDSDGAIASNAKARPLIEALVVEDPTNVSYRRRLVISYQNAGNYRIESDPPAALENFRKMIALAEEIVATDPANATARSDLSWGHTKAADLLAGMHDYVQALSHFRQELEICEKLISDAPQDILLQLRRAGCRASMAKMQARLAKPDAALEESGRTIALLDQIHEDTTNWWHRNLRASTYEELGHTYITLAEDKEAQEAQVSQHRSAARDMFRQALAILEDLRSRGRLPAANQTWVEELNREIAKCDAALQK
jgi:non-specific serine/threonine protein kinase/serine/threonine-protein kinase